MIYKTLYKNIFIFQENCFHTLHIVPTFISYFYKLFFTAQLFFLSHFSNPFQSDTEFWDKMQAEWEELARRNWLTDNEQPQIPSNVSPYEKVKKKNSNKLFKNICLEF